LNDLEAFNNAVRALRGSPQRCAAVRRHNLEKVEEYFIARCAERYEELFEAAIAAPLGSAARLEHE
jgi:glycosyltransferase involved in cell wall biosynthesis